MKKFKFICRTTVIVIMALVIIITGLNTLSQNNSGYYSAVCGRITERSRDFILENFGEYEKVEDFLIALDIYGMTEFTYDGTMNELLQHFDFDEFVFEKSFTGLCFDFACFAKCTSLVWAESKGIDLKCYVYDVKTSAGPHSYNYFIHGDKTYFLDITHDNTCYAKDKLDNAWGPRDIKNYTPKEFSKALGDRVIIKR